MNLILELSNRSERYCRNSAFDFPQLPLRSFCCSYLVMYFPFACFSLDVHVYFGRQNTPWPPHTFWSFNSTGASRTKWAIEYEEPAGQAFVQNHPEAAVFVENCNVVLKYAKSIFPFGCTKHITPVSPTQLWLFAFAGRQWTSVAMSMIVSRLPRLLQEQLNFQMWRLRISLCLVK